MGYLKFLLPASAFGSPGPPASGTHHPGAAPCGTKMPVKRVLGVAAVLVKGVCAGTIESNSGSASATPAPWSTVRREMCFLVINILLPRQGLALSYLRGDETIGFWFISNASLFTMPSTMDENR